MSRGIIKAFGDEGGGFIEEIKKRKDVRLIEIDKGRRNALAEEIVREIRELSAPEPDLADEGQKIL